MHATISIKGKLNFHRACPALAVRFDFSLVSMTPQPNSSPTSTKAHSQLLLQAHIFLVGWLNSSAQGSVLDPFFCTPSLDDLTQSVAVDTSHVLMTLRPKF